MSAIEEVPDGEILDSEQKAEIYTRKVGRPKDLARRIREMVGDDPARIANILFDILEDTEARNTDRIAAARELFDRGWGKAPAYAPIVGEDPLGASELDVAIRDIADQLVARRAHPKLDAELIKREIEEGVRPNPAEAA